MTKEILIIDDHSPIVEGYKSMLSFSDHGYLLKFKEAQTCETAYGQIINIENCFDIVFLDLSLAPYDNMKKIFQLFFNSNFNINYSINWSFYLHD